MEVSTMQKHISRITGIVFLSAALLLGLLPFPKKAQAAPAAATRPSAARVRVGVYDSRAIAVAFARSELWKNQLASKMQEHNKAKADGDEKKVKELEAWGEAQQRRLHRQGFSNEPVDNILTMIKDELPNVAQQTNVSIIVPKADWQDDAAVEVIDVTDQMIECFHPSEQTRAMVADLRKRAPIDLDKIAKNP
jgi:hypothetical protein